MNVTKEDDTGDSGYAYKEETDMNKMHEITLSEFIKELQAIEKKYGSWSISSIGGCAGIVGNMESPFSFTFMENGNSWEIHSERVYIASHSEDVGKKE